MNEKKTSVAEAVQILTKALSEDKDFYYTYQSNIAVAFQNEASKQKSRDSIRRLHNISNKAAQNFLNIWITERQNKNS